MFSDYYSTDMFFKVITGGLVLSQKFESTNIAREIKYKVYKFLKLLTICTGKQPLKVNFKNITRAQQPEQNSQYVTELPQR